VRSPNFFFLFFLNHDVSVKMKPCREKKITDTIGRRVTRNSQPMPLTSCPPASCVSLDQVPNARLTEIINFPLTKSRRMRKDEGVPGGETADKLGRMVLRNTQPMTLTSWPTGSFPSLCQVPNGDHQFSTHKIATCPQT
jgi:hypothetical protein